jgi:hypothetical protein
MEELFGLPIRNNKIFCCLQPFHRLQHTCSLQDSPPCWLQRFMYSPVEYVQSMPRLAVSYEFVSQGILAALGLGTGRNRLEENKLALEHSELYSFLIYIETQLLILNCLSIHPSVSLSLSVCLYMYGCTALCCTLATFSLS